MRLYLTIFLCYLAYVPSSAQRTIGSIPLPDSACTRVIPGENSFGAWLINLSLMPAGSPVLDYRKRIYKSDEDTTIAAVVDMDISGRRLEQCMDILIRLYAQYLWDNDRSGELNLPLPGGYWLAWKDWKIGIRPVFKGIKVSYKKSAVRDDSFSQFEAYLRNIYAESHTQQFYHQYTPVQPENVQIGDFFVLKGSKSHAVMVVDLMITPAGAKYALIGHGDTPACQFHLLNLRKSQPWIPLNPNTHHLPLPIRRKMTWDGLRRFSQEGK